jgi:molybdate transport system ATP-binding protein
MSSLQISQGTFRLGDTRTLSIDHLTLQSGESWAFVGANGSGKSALAKALAGELTLLKGDRQSNFSRITRLSFEQLQKLVSEEWQRNNTDMLSPGEDDTGRTTAEIIQDEVKDAARCQQLAERFGITSLLSRRFKYLSTGETRKTLLCQALMSQPDLLILDEPFDGLDVHSRQNLALLLAELNAEGYTLVLVLNRFDEIPDFVQNAGVLADCALTEIGEKSALLQQALIAQLAHSENLAGMALPEPDAPPARDQLTAGEPLIVLKEGVVSYNDRPIINHLNWTVRPGEHWQISGPNGAGKSTLLSLVTGDHAQGYSNDLTLLAAVAAAAKPSGILKSTSVTSAAACIWTIASVRPCAMSFFPAILTPLAFIRLFRTNSVNWRNSGWTSPGLMRKPPMRRSIACHGANSVWR